VYRTIFFVVVAICNNRRNETKSIHLCAVLSTFQLDDRRVRLRLERKHPASSGLGVFLSFRVPVPHRNDHQLTVNAVDCESIVVFHFRLATLRECLCRPLPLSRDLRHPQAHISPGPGNGFSLVGVILGPLVAVTERWETQKYQTVATC
jgi:hypothetical protein